MNNLAADPAQAARVEAMRQDLHAWMRSVIRSLNGKDYPEPSEPGPVTITFHADRGDQGLSGYAGDVYAHTGVITNLSDPQTGRLSLPRRWCRRRPPELAYWPPAAGAPWR